LWNIARHRIVVSRDILKTLKNQQAGARDKGVQTGSFSLRAACTCRPSTFFFLTPMTGNPRDDRPAIVSVDLRYRRRGRFIKVSIPTLPSRIGPGTRLTKYYNDGRPNALVLPVVSGPNRVRVSARTMRACARFRVSVCVSPPPKRIRGKRARRWINTKTSVTHDQLRPSSVSSSASACAHRRALLRDGIGVALVLQDVHLDQYHWKLSKQIIDRAKKNPEAAHPDRPTNRTNRTRRYITHTGVAREETRTRKRKSTAARREARKRETRSVLKNKKLPYIFQALTCAWVGWVGRWIERGSVGRREEGP